MRVLYISQTYSPHDHRFLTTILEQGHEVFSWQMDLPQGLERRQLPAGINAVDGNKDLARNCRPLARFRAARRVVQDVSPDLIHAGPLQQCAFYAALAGFHPLVSMSWGWDLLIEARKPIPAWVAKQTIRRSDVLIVDADAVKSVAVELGMPVNRIVQFPWGIDLEHFSPGESKIREDLGWGDAFVLLSTRKMESLYGVDIIVDAFLAAARENPNLRLIMLGQGTMKEEIEAHFETSGMRSRVHFGGQVGFDDLPAYYRAADVYISASHSDGSSVSLMEALACGIPALLSDIPGNREWVTPGEQGWWFPDGDARALTQAILNSYEQRTGHSRMSKMAREIAEKKGNWEDNKKGVSEAYILALEVVHKDMQ